MCVFCPASTIYAGLLWQRKTSKNIRRKSLPVICIPRIPEATFLVKTPTYLVTGAGRGLGVSLPVHSPHVLCSMLTIEISTDS